MSATTGYNNNTHEMLEVDASLESPMQGLWTGMLRGATLRSDLKKYAHVYLRTHD
jgi:hypothetical protein